MKRLVVISAALFGALAVPAAASASAPAWKAAPAATQSYVREARREITPAEAKRIALRRVAGEVVDIRRIKGAFRVRIIARDGRVVDIVVDANTGRIR